MIRLPNNGLFFVIVPSLLLCIALNVDVSNATPTSVFGNEKSTLSNDVDHSQSFCNHFEAMSKVTGDENKTVGVEIGQALNGAHLNVIIYVEEELGYFNYNKIEGIDRLNPGIFANILDYIAEKGNITWRNSFGTVNVKDNNSTFIDLLQWGTDNYDIFLGDFAQSHERRSVGIEFCDTIFDGSPILVRNIEPADNSIAWFNWLMPFEVEVWYVILATIIVSAYIYQLIELCADQGNDRSFRKSTMDNLYLSFMNSTQNFAHVPTTLGGRIFVFFYAFWSLLIVATYTANLASLLVEKSSSRMRIESVEDVIDNNLIMCTHTSSVAEDYVKKIYPGIVPNNILSFPNETPMYNALNAKECDVLLGNKHSYLHNFMGKKEFNENCQLGWEGRELKHLGKSFATTLDAMRCTSLVSAVFNYYLGEMEDNGTLEVFWERHIEYQSTLEKSCTDKSNIEGISRRRLSNNSNGRKLKSSIDTVDRAERRLTSASTSTKANDTDSERLSLREMAGTFLVQVIGSLIAVACALASRCEKKKNLKRHNSKSFKRQLSTAKASRVLLSADSFSSADDGASKPERNDTSGNNVSSQLHIIQNQLSVILSKQEELQDRLNVDHQLTSSSDGNDNDNDNDDDDNIFDDDDDIMQNKTATVTRNEFELDDFATELGNTH